MIEHINVIGTLSDQITALLELMQCTNDSADISSIRVASEMCLTMHDELMVEVDKMSIQSYLILIYKVVVSC